MSNSKKNRQGGYCVSPGVKKNCVKGEEMNVLVVDSEEGARVVFSNTLLCRGYQATFASSGEDALDLIRKSLFDLVITDSKLPAMDGLQLLDEIKKRTPEVDVIIVTDSGTIETYLKAISLGAAEYICKPFRMKDLKWIMYAFLARRKGSDLDRFREERRILHTKMDDLIKSSKPEAKPTEAAQPGARESTRP
jgi:two-component system response regulator (stage 0 sporulation protein F)